MNGSIWVGIAIGLAVMVGLLVVIGSISLLASRRKEKKYAREAGWGKGPNGWTKTWPNRCRVDATDSGSHATCFINPVQGELITIDGFSNKLYVMQFSDWLLERSGVRYDEPITREIVVARQAQYAQTDLPR